MSGISYILPSRELFVERFVQPHHFDSDVDNDKSCAICFSDPYDDKDHNPVSFSSQQSCDHVFGRSCILAWFGGGANTCPMCRCELFIRPVSADEDDDEDEDDEYESDDHVDYGFGDYDDYEYSDEELVWRSTSPDYATPAFRLEQRYSITDLPTDLSYMWSSLWQHLSTYRSSLSSLVSSAPDSPATQISHFEKTFWRENWDRYEPGILRVIFIDCLCAGAELGSFQEEDWVVVDAVLEYMRAQMRDMILQAEEWRLGDVQCPVLYDQLKDGCCERLEVVFANLTERVREEELGDEEETEEVEDEVEAAEQSGDLRLE